MTTYTDVFGTDVVPPADQGYQSFNLTSNTATQWAYNAPAGSSVLARINDITCTAGVVLSLPDATAVSNGESLLFRNVGANSLTVKDFSGGAVATVSAGSASYLYLTNNGTAAGSWGVIAYGVGTSAVDAATLAGYGLMASGASLNVAHAVTSVAVATTIDATYRAKLVNFTGGAATISLTAVATMGDNFFFMFRNSGTGTVTIDPASAETIDGTSGMSVQPGESVIVFCSGTAWYTVGYGRATIYQFTQLTKDVSAGGTIALSATEANNKLLTFNGAPAADFTIVVPSVVAVYYVLSEISTAVTMTIKTAAGVGIGVSRNQRVTALCDGTNVYAASSPSSGNATISLIDGSATDPAMNFSTALQTGFYKGALGGIGYTFAGVTIGEMTANGLNMAIGGDTQNIASFTNVGLDYLTISNGSGALISSSGSTDISKRFELRNVNGRIHWEIAGASGATFSGVASGEGVVGSFANKKFHLGSNAASVAYVDSSGMTITGTSFTANNVTVNSILTLGSGVNVTLANDAYLNWGSGGSQIQASSGGGTPYLHLHCSSNVTPALTISNTDNIYGKSGTTAMTDGFFYIPSATGAPSGVPTVVAGRVPMYYDATNNHFYIYNGAWKKVLLA